MTQEQAWAVHTILCGLDHGPYVTVGCYNGLYRVTVSQSREKPWLVTAQLSTLRECLAWIGVNVLQADAA
jgi:hypothetical protein